MEATAEVTAIDITEEDQKESMVLETERNHTRRKLLLTRIKTAQKNQRSLAHQLSFNNQSLKLLHAQNLANQTTLEAH